MTRSSHRIQFRVLDRPLIELWPIEGETQKGSLENLSEGGASVLLRGSAQDLDNCRAISCNVALDDLEPMNYAALIKRRQHIPKINETRLGLEFQNIPDASRRQLHSALLKWQRRYIRTGVAT